MTLDDDLDKILRKEGWSIRYSNNWECKIYTHPQYRPSMYNPLFSAEDAMLEARKK